MPKYGQRSLKPRTLAGYPLRNAPTPDLLLRIEVLTIHRCGERTEVDKALALLNANNDTLIVTVAVRLENRITNLVHLRFLSLAATIAASC